MTTIQSIPLDKLYPSPANVRKTGTKEGIAELAKSIHIHGLLNNLVVQPGGKEGTFSVLAGGRRLAALNHFVNGKLLPTDWPVPCNVIEIDGDISSEEISLAENEMRQAMHPADQFEAFKKLADEGQGNDTIAAKFGVTPRVVEQRLKLARVSPKLVKVYRDDEMDLEQLMAFTVSTDHKHQEKIWKDLPKYAKEQRRADPILRAITEKHIPIDNDLAAFVGIEAYEKAGGQVLRDLFAEEEGGQAYFTNAGLLDSLAAQKLEQLAEEVRAEGWKWVGVCHDLSWEEERKYTKRQAKHSHSPEQIARAAALRKEIAALEKQYPDDDENDRPIEIEDQLSNLDDEATAAEEGNEVWGVKDKELPGAIVTIDHGKSTIMRGLMKAEEARAAKKAEPVKAKGKGAKQEERGLSAALVETLTSHRTAELQVKMMDGNPKVALTAIVHALVQHVIAGLADSPIQISGDREKLRDEAAAKSPAAKRVDDAVKALQKSAPDDD